MFCIFIISTLDSLEKRTSKDGYTCIKETTWGTGHNEGWRYSNYVWYIFVICIRISIKWMVENETYMYIQSFLKWFHCGQTLTLKNQIDTVYHGFHQNLFWITNRFIKWSLIDQKPSDAFKWVLFLAFATNVSEFESNRNKQQTSKNRHAN